MARQGFDRDPEDLTGRLKDDHRAGKDHPIPGTAVVPLNWGVSGVAWHLLLMATGMGIPQTMPRRPCLT